MLIPKEIDENEILVRFVFLDDFKKKHLEESKLITQDVFLDTRNSGISLQRSLYTTENNCKKYALNVVNKKYVGFAIFLKKTFSQIIEEYKIERNEFNASIEYTPLDFDNQYLIDRNNSNIEDEGNPSHSDIIYLNPAIKNDEPTPNTSLRLFSKKLMSKCKLIIDNGYEEDDFKMGKFSEFFW
jgi:hypothetical protein